MTINIFCFIFTPDPGLIVSLLCYRNMTPEPGQKEGKAQQALRRLFSAMGLGSGGRLGKAQSSSMEQLSPPLKPTTNFSETSGPTHVLKKAPSLQNLRLVCPLYTTLVNMLPKSKYFIVFHIG